MSARVAVSQSVLSWALQRSERTYEEALTKYPHLGDWMDGSLQPTLRDLEVRGVEALPPKGLDHPGPILVRSGRRDDCRRDPEMLHVDRRINGVPRGIAAIEVAIVVDAVIANAGRLHSHLLRLVCKYDILIYYHSHTYCGRMSQLPFTVFFITFNTTSTNFQSRGTAM